MTTNITKSLPKPNRRNRTTLKPQHIRTEDIYSTPSYFIVFAQDRVRLFTYFLLMVGAALVGVACFTSRSLR